MFGLFENDVKRVRRLRAKFENIRQRVLYKMNGYEQYCFGSAYEEIVEEIEERFNDVAVAEPSRWLQIGEELMTTAKQSWRQSNAAGGIASEGGRAGAEAIALMSLRASARGYTIPEAKTLQTDIAAFEAKTTKFMKERTDLMDMIPQK